VLENGPQFTLSEFVQFCHLNGIRHTKVPLYHPSSNGLAECAVQTFKKGFKKMSEGLVQDKISRFLFSYCITPQTSTGISPAELLMDRTLRSHVHLLNLSVSQKIEHKQEQQKLNHDQKAVERTFAEGEKVYARNYSSIGNKWLSGQVISVTQCSVEVKLSSGLVIHRYFDQICKRAVDNPVSATDPDIYADFPANISDNELSQASSMEQAPQNRRYPLKIRKAPDRLNL